MGGQVKELRDHVRQKILDLRSYKALLDKIWIEELFDSSTEEEKKSFLILRTREGLENWIKKHSSRTYHSFTQRELRELAVKCGIPNYSKLDKLDLLIVLRERKII